MKQRQNTIKEEHLNKDTARNKVSLSPVKKAYSASFMGLTLSYASPANKRICFVVTSCCLYSSDVFVQVPYEETG